MTAARPLRRRGVGNVTQDEADRTLGELLIEHGINHIDVAAQLRRGRASPRDRAWTRLRRVLPRHQDRRQDRRGRVRGDRALPGAPRHRPRPPDPAPQPGRGRGSRDRVQPGGAIEAAVGPSTRPSAGALYRGHRPRRHRRAAHTFARCSSTPSTPSRCPTITHVAEPANISPTSMRSLALCASHGVAVQTIKAISRAAWSAGRRLLRRHLADEPPRDPDAIHLAVGWVACRSGVFLNTVATSPCCGSCSTRPRAPHRPADRRRHGAVRGRLRSVPLFV